jgi:phage protein U
MYAQLGTTEFSGAKSFVSFSSDEEAIIVELAVIGRRARLQGAGIGLRNINLSLFLHQEYCSVADEIAKLRNSKNTFEVLPLLWGNGIVEGNFVIMSLGETKTYMDDIGNTISATISVELKEYYNDDKLNGKQVEAQKKAFAVGNKNPPAKSKRANPVACEKRVSQLNSGIRANAGALNLYIQGYTNLAGRNAAVLFVLNRITEDTQKVYNEAISPSSCANSVPLLSNHAKDVITKAGVLAADIKQNQTQYANIFFPPNLLSMKAHHVDLQKAIQVMDSALIVSPLIKGAITIK